MSSPLVASKSEQEIATIAYASVAGVPTQEMNDRNRLGFHVYLYLTGNIDTVLDAVREARARLHVTSAEAAESVRASLRAQGIEAT